MSKSQCTEFWEAWWQGYLFLPQCAITVGVKWGRSALWMPSFRPCLRLFRGFPPFISSIVTFTGAGPPSLSPTLLPTPIHFYKMTTAWPDISPLTFQCLLTPTSSAVKSLQVRNVTTISVPCHCCSCNTETCHCAPRKSQEDENSRERCLGMHFHTEEVVMKRHLVISSNSGIYQWGRERAAPFVSSEIPEGMQRGQGTWLENMVLRSHPRTVVQFDSDAETRASTGHNMWRLLGVSPSQIPVLSFSHTVVHPTGSSILGYSVVHAVAAVGLIWKYSVMPT